jgi:thiol-disulfide isomerase/thioredoxin
MRKILLPILGLFLVTQAIAAEKKIWAKPFLNKKAPDLVVEKWLSKEPAHAGKFVLVDFWATWCGPYRKAIPELNALHKKFGEELVVIGISNESAATVTKFAGPKMEYFSAIDTKERMKKAVGVTGIPHVLLIDPQGIVRWEGYPLLTDHLLTEDVVKELLAKHGKVAAAIGQ